MKRKHFLKSSAAVIGAGLLPSLSRAELFSSPKKITRFAFISDIHVQPGTIPESGMTRALQHVKNYHPGVDFIINGGDSIMDSLEATKEQTQVQWDLFHKILNANNSLPIYHCIGNHDVWGWFVKENKPEKDPLYGKTWAVETQKMKNRYYSFDRDKWHFVVLDSTQLNPEGGYIGMIDAEQMDWLGRDLASVPSGHFTCIISHIPLLSICAGLFFDKTETNGDLIIKRNLMHTDYFPLKKLFLQHNHIRACLSGHIHMQDELEYLGITYYCNGAISGNWWKGTFREFPPAYAVFEFNDDGTTKRTMVNYG